ncbi:hypothetical protein MIMGU_mgv1a016632mg [Erythranthe guttata]|uniref:Uncharacterized protein n=1 Tax=Erythranthe guttata TaxID=4155 RepID=A0A022R7E6_ERYGU|nr:hypothetical protein MIMGU_mgv1a016632mg [Erythranthe guttata]
MHPLPSISYNLNAHFKSLAFSSSPAPSTILTKSSKHISPSPSESTSATAASASAAVITPPIEATQCRSSSGDILPSPLESKWLKTLSYCSYLSIVYIYKQVKSKNSRAKIGILL